MRRLAHVLLASFVPVLFIAWGVSSSAYAEEKKPAALKPGTIKPVVDNEKVKSWEVTYKPGQGSAMADRAPRLVHALSGGTMRRTMADGKTSDIVWKAGETRWLTQERFSNQNVGKTTVHLLVVQPK